MDRVNNVTYKVNTEMKNGCKEIILRIYFLTYEDTLYCRASEAVDLSSALQQECVFSVLKGPQILLLLDRYGLVSHTIEIKLCLVTESRGFLFVCIHVWYLLRGETHMHMKRIKYF